VSTDEAGPLSVPDSDVEAGRDTEPDTAPDAEGLPVADLIRVVMYADGYGQFTLGRESFRELPENAETARCGDCPVCTVKCPYGVRVAERVSRAQELFA